MSVTITDLSRQLGISVSTVSKALNNYTDVSEATRDLVQQTARDLGYHPSAAARSLRRGQTNKIALVLNTPIDYIGDYLTGMISGAVSAAEPAGKNLILYTAGTNEPDTLLRICRSGEVDGVILSWSHNILEPIQILLDEEMPFVVMGRRVLNDRVSYIVPDYYDGSYQATKHLIDLGHQRIAFMTRPELGMTNQERFLGYQDALRDNNIPYQDELIVETCIEAASGTKPTYELLNLSSPPTAIFAFHDLVAVDALQVIQKQGYRVPEDISLIGFDGLPSSNLTTPAITTVQQPLTYIGKRIIEMLTHLISGGNPIQEVVPVHLVIRASTSKYDDKLMIDHRNQSISKQGGTI